MVMDPVQKAKDEMGGLEKFIGKLPGMKGYREKEMRRDADKQVRDTLARHLESRRAQADRPAERPARRPAACSGWTTWSASWDACSSSSTGSRRPRTASAALRA